MDLSLSKNGKKFSLKPPKKSVRQLQTDQTGTQARSGIESDLCPAEQLEGKGNPGYPRSKIPTPTPQAATKRCNTYGDSEMVPCTSRGDVTNEYRSTDGLAGDARDRDRFRYTENDFNATQQTEWRRGKEQQRKSGGMRAAL